MFRSSTVMEASQNRQLSRVLLTKMKSTVSKSFFKMDGYFNGGSEIIGGSHDSTDLIELLTDSLAMKQPKIVSEVFKSPGNTVAFLNTLIHTDPLCTPIAKFNVIHSEMLVNITKSRKIYFLETFLMNVQFDCNGPNPHNPETRVIGVIREIENQNALEINILEN